MTRRLLILEDDEIERVLEWYAHADEMYLEEGDAKVAAKIEEVLPG